VPDRAYARVTWWLSDRWLWRRQRTRSERPSLDDGEKANQIYIGGRARVQPWGI